MITKNFKNRLSEILCSTDKSSILANDYTGLTVVNTSGQTRYLCGYMGSGYPRSVSYDRATSDTSSGIAIGIGTTPVTENDISMEAILPGSQYSCSITHVRTHENGIPKLTFTITITNVSSSSYSISEIGYQQSIPCKLTITEATYSTSNCLLDHTLLDSPITLAPNETAVIEYSLMSYVS